ncbi:MAG: glutamate 5-kinase [Candidatus Omnitrophica bacterium]|nr:glutamate 5-kinase [Candidatus Omnitrophota bacterium]
MSKNRLRRITVKIGTRVLTGKNNRLDRKSVRNLSEQICDLLDRGIEVVVVSSGAIGAGLGILAPAKKHRSLSELQAIASVGQTHLMDVYNEFFNKRGYVAGQILLTQEDLNDRKRFLNIRYTLNSLLKCGAVPVINENDSVSTEEIKFGDNDRLSSLVADLADSDLMVVLTDVEGLYGRDGSVLKEVRSINGDVRALCVGKGCEVSTGGMMTKIEAVRNATHAGIDCVIAGGRKKDVLVSIAEGRSEGTFFPAGKTKIRARKRWIAFSLKPRGTIFVDEGAQKAIVKGNRSLLPSGIVRAAGKFAAGDLVVIAGPSCKEIARGLSNYSSAEIDKIKGLKSAQIEQQLGYNDYDEAVHRDNLAIVEEE